MLRKRAIQLSWAIALMLVSTNGFTQKTVVVIPLIGNEAPTYKTVFITQNFYQGALGGPKGADSICQTEARSGGLNFTSKFYKAWISGGLAEDLTQQGRVFTRSALPYRRVDGVKVADNYADLVDGSLSDFINVTADGTKIGLAGNTVWTGLYATGSFAFDNCNNWTATSNDYFGRVGLWNLLNSNWSYSGTRVSCLGSARLYCIEQ